MVIEVLTGLDTAPQVSAAMSLALVQGLIAAGKPVTTFKSAKLALARVRATGETLRTLHTATPPPKPESATKAADTTMDRAAKAVFDRLKSYTALDPVTEEAEDAARIQAILFPNGLELLNLKYREEWAEVDAIRERIRSQKLGPALATLIGSAFVDNLYRAHDAYGEALNLTKPKEEAAEIAKLAAPLKALRDALGTYAQVLVAAAKNEEIPVDAVVKALEPMTAVKNDVKLSAKNRKKDGGSVGEPKPDEPPISPEPLPPVD